MGEQSVIRNTTLEALGVTEKKDDGVFEQGGNGKGGEERQDSSYTQEVKFTSMALHWVWGVRRKTNVKGYFGDEEPFQIPFLTIIFSQYLALWYGIHTCL